MTAIMFSAAFYIPAPGDRAVAVSPAMAIAS